MNYSKFSLFLVLMVSFFDWMGISLVYPLFSAMLFSPDSSLVSVDISTTTRSFYLGILIAIMPLAQFFSGPILGMISDQKGRRPLLIGTLFLGLVGYILCSLSVKVGSIALLIGARALVGIAAGNTAIVGATIADLSNEKNKTKNFGLYNMACGVGFTSGSFLGGELSLLGFTFPFFFSGLALFANLLLIFFFFKETVFSVQKSPNPLMAKWNVGLKNVKKAFTLLELRTLFFVVLIFCFGWSFFYEFIPVSWIADYRFDSYQIGLCFSYGAAVYALSSGVLIRPIVNRFCNKRVLLFSLSLMGILMLTLFFAHPMKNLIWIYLPLFNFFAALLFPTSTSMVSSYAEKESQGEVLGILQSVQSLAFAISPLTAGILLGIHPHMPFFIGGVAMLGAFLLLYESSFRKSLSVL